ncbi:MAG: sarcosine oxidase subunit gamma [Alphaproteobacteria bacterium]
MSDKFEVSATQSSPLDSAVISAGPMLVMAPVSDCMRLSLRIAKKDLSKAATAFGRDIPENIGEMTSTGKKTALCLGPDEWLLLAPEDEGEKIAAHFAKMSEKTTHSLVDVGHRTVGIDISGPAAAMVLNAGCPLDLDAMPVGGCTRTVMDKAEIILMKLAKERYRVEITRSFAEYVWNFFSSAGREFDISKR